jgi:hypothetical protein
MNDTVVLALVGVLVMAIGAALLVFLVHLRRGDSQVARRGIEVTAQVVGAVEHEGEEDPIYGGGGGGWAPVVTFRTIDGELVSASSERVYAGARRRVPTDGTSFRIRYNPGNPRDIYIRGWDTPARFMFPGFVTAGIVTVLLGAFIVYLAFTVT